MIILGYIHTVDLGTEDEGEAATNVSIWEREGAAGCVGHRERW